MNSDSTSKRDTRIVQTLLLLVGAMIVVYAVSDHPLYGGEPGFGRVQMLMTAVGLGLALCGLLPISIAGRILLLAITSLVMLAFAEIAGEIVLGPRHRPIFQFDDRLIFKFVPSRQSVMTHARVNGGETVAHRINSDGFRGDELRPAGEATRVVVYGDSFIHAFYTRQEDTFVAQLGKLLAERLGRTVEAVNAGVSSYGPDQISLKMEQELPLLRPDLVVVAIFAGNDYGDLLRHKLFRLEAEGVLVKNQWRLDPKLRMRFELGQQESILIRALRSTRVSESAPRDLDFLREEADREYRNFVLARDDIVTNTNASYYNADVSLTPSSASARYKIMLMQAVLRRIRDVAGQHAVPLIFLFIPHPSDVMDHYDGWRIDRARFPDYDSRNQIAPLEDTARGLGVPFASLYEIFRVNGAKSLYFHGGDDHWNAAGQQLAAIATTELLLRHGLPRANRGPATSSRSIDAAPSPPRGR